MDVSAYPRLFSPLRIGHLTVRNRFVQTAHTKHFARDGLDTERDLAYHVDRARGGAGLLITGNRLVHPTASVAAPAFPRGYLRAAIPLDRRMTEAVHEHGAAIVAQLNHVGVNGSSDAADDLRVLLGPSAVRSPLFGESPKVMDETDMHEVAEWWALSAVLAREGGFDGVEVHLSHGYLLHQFLSPLYNKRTDAYGGSLENRLRFPQAVIGEVRRHVGEDFVVGVRIPLSDGVDGGLTVADAARIAANLEASERIDYLNVTIGGYHDGLALAIAPSDTPDGWLLEMTAQVKQALARLPVFAVGGIKDAAQAEQILATGGADMVAITRAQIADPEFPNKVQAGHEDEIYHCIRGNQGCIARTGRGLPMACTVNPAAGREQRFGLGTLTRTKSPAFWLVVGGGPAGMKAAETLARRGHRVTLLEQSDQLGGQVNLILKTPGRESFAWIVRDLQNQMNRHGVDVRLGTVATLEVVRSLAPDGVIVATGALPSRLGFSSVAPLVERLPGVDQSNVLTVWDVLLGSRPVGERVLILDDDGGRYAAGAAEVLLDRGKRVELASRFTALFPATAATLDMGILYRRLLSKGLTFQANVWARSIEGPTVTLFNLYTGAEVVLPDVDTVVLATGRMANDASYHQLLGAAPHLYRVGDCLAPRTLDHAIYEGYLAGRELLSPAERYILEGELWPAEQTPTG